MNLTNKNIAVTGASGFLGFYIVRALISRNANIICIVRNKSKMQLLQKLFPQEAKILIREANLKDPNSLNYALKKVDILIHNAAVVSLGNISKQELIESNVNGTQTVIEAMYKNNINRLVMTSSAEVYVKKKNHTYQEQDPILDTNNSVGRLGWYRLSKALAERRAFELSQKFNISTSTIRPHGIYGVNDTKYTRIFFLLNRFPITFSLYYWYYPMVYAADLAEAMVRVLEKKPKTITESYNVCAQPYQNSYMDLFRGWKKTYKKKRIRIPLIMPLKFKMDISKASYDLNWKNRSPEEAFKEILAIKQGKITHHQIHLCDRIPINR